MDDSEVESLVKKGWIKTWFMFDTQAVDEKVLKDLLVRLAGKIKMEQSVFVLEENFSEAEKVDPVPQFKSKGITEVYSQILEVVLIARDFEALVNITINFGPTAVEILEPEKISLSMRDAQNALASISSMMNRYASAGRGGVMIAPV